MRMEMSFFANKVLTQRADVVMSVSAKPKGLATMGDEMLNALDINTKEIIASGENRDELRRAAAALVGEEGYCIRPAIEEKIVLHEDWGTSDGRWWL